VWAPGLRARREQDARRSGGVARIGLWALVVGAVLMGGFAAPLEASSQQDKAIIRASADVLDRQPTDRELRRYRDLMTGDLDGAA